MRRFFGGFPCQCGVVEFFFVKGQKKRGEIAIKRKERGKVIEKEEKRGMEKGKSGKKWNRKREKWGKREKGE